ncbi:MAG: pitrilysin family protein [Candidatus Binatia bacterium]
MPRSVPRALATVAMVCLALTPARAAQPYAERVRQAVFPNGLKVLLLEDHKAPVAVLQVWYRVGSRNEQLGRTGLSHLLEHLMFKGTKKVGPEEYSKIIQHNGGNDNAFTSDDATTYFATIASDRLGVVIDLEADRMQNLTFEDAQFTPELQVVMEERRLRTEDNPVSALFEDVSAVAFSAHPYQWPIIGWMDDLKQATRQDALDYYRTYYRPGNAVVVCVGDFSADTLLAQLETAFGSIPAAGPVPAVRAVEPPQQGENRTVLRRPAQLPFVAVAYHVPNLKGPDGPVLEVISALLSGGRSARLYRHLVYEKRVARDAGASYDLTTIDPGLFTLYAQPMPGKSVTLVEQELLGQVERLQRSRVDDRELTKVKNGLEAAFVFGQDSLFYQGMVLGQYEMAGDWRSIDSYLPGMRAVTAENILRVAQTYFTPLNRTVGTLEPLPIAGKTSAPARAGAHRLVH